VIAANAIPIFMTSKTSELLGSKYQCTVPVDGMNAFDSRKVDIGYFGPAHTPDNIVVYLPDDRVLFGGCMVKSMASMNAGNTQDADMRNWPKAISGLLGKYRDATQVVPGHGEPGGLELLHHTLDLLK
jgi:metallo-beta-lactamase class B